MVMMACQPCGLWTLPQLGNVWTTHPSFSECRILKRPVTHRYTMFIENHWCYIIYMYIYIYTLINIQQSLLFSQQQNWTSARIVRTIHTRYQHHFPISLLSIKPVYLTRIVGGWGVLCFAKHPLWHRQVPLRHNEFPMLQRLSAVHLTPVLGWQLDVDAKTSCFESTSSHQRGCFSPNELWMLHIASHCFTLLHILPWSRHAPRRT